MNETLNKNIIYFSMNIYVVAVLVLLFSFDIIKVWVSSVVVVDTETSKYTIIAKSCNDFSKGIYKLVKNYIYYFLLPVYVFGTAFSRLHII